MCQQLPLLIFPPVSVCTGFFPDATKPRMFHHNLLTFPMLPKPSLNSWQWPCLGVRRAKILTDIDGNVPEEMQCRKPTRLEHSMKFQASQQPSQKEEHDGLCDSPYLTKGSITGSSRRFYIFYFHTGSWVESFTHIFTQWKCPRIPSLSQHSKSSCRRKMINISIKLKGGAIGRKFSIMRECHLV